MVVLQQHVGLDVAESTQVSCVIREMSNCNLSDRCSRQIAILHASRCSKDRYNRKTCIGLQGCLNAIAPPIWAYKYVCI